MHAAIRAKQISITRPAIISPTLAAGDQIDICAITLAASCTPDANTSLGATPPPPAALAAWRKLLTIV